WVPSETPETPARVGHDMWFHTPEDESAPREMRVMYWLNDQCNQNASDVNMVVVNPALAECPPPTPGEGTINTMYGGDDADQDGEPDGIKVYELGADDLGGVWRCLWTAADTCGPLSPHRRTHDPQRMLVANDDEKSQLNQGLVYEGYHMAKEKTYEGYEDPRPVTAVQVAALEGAGYKLPDDRKMDEDDDGEEFVERWLGLRSGGDGGTSTTTGRRSPWSSTGTAGPTLHMVRACGSISPGETDTARRTRHRRPATNASLTGGPTRVASAIE
ncbi:MAG: hypothetical protein KBI47_22250, partial [Armatimonadetes bacterium]|nr:hypothetical protein [Armatimonadota bacterium]